MYALLEAKGLTPALQASAVREGATEGSPKSGAGKGKASKQAPKPKKPPKSRGIAWDYVDSDDEGGEEGPAINERAAKGKVIRPLDIPNRL